MQWVEKEKPITKRSPLVGDYKLRYALSIALKDLQVKRLCNLLYYIAYITSQYTLSCTACDVIYWLVLKPAWAMLVCRQAGVTGPSEMFLMEMPTPGSPHSSSTPLNPVHLGHVSIQIQHDHEGGGRGRESKRGKGG